MLKLIVCCDQKNGISKNNKLPWHLKEEMHHFKTTTLNHYVVMGRKTFDSIGKILPKRHNIIFSHNKNLKIDNALVTDNVEYVLKLAKKHDVYIIGGSQIYKLFEPYYDELLISRLDDDYHCDIFLNINFKYFYLKEQKAFNEFKLDIYGSYNKKILWGNVCGEYYKKQLIQKNNQLLKKYHIKPCLAIIQAGNHYASNVYIRNKINLAASLTIETKLFTLDENIKEEQLINLIEECNQNKDIHGILIQLPLPNHINKQKIFESIDPNKDVDGFGPLNVGKLWINNKHQQLVPCTPLGIMKLLTYYHIKLEGKNVVIIGRSEIVSKPLINLMLRENATVQICHSRTKNLKQVTKKADILICAIGKAHFINQSYLKKNAIVIDVGINKNEENKTVGDVDLLDVINHVKYISPVPNGIGKMTLIMLFNNLLICYEKQITNK